MDPYRQPDKGLLLEFGSRIRTTRLNQNITQEELASRAGVSIGVLRATEKGGNLTLMNMLRLLRALRKLEEFDLLLPETGPSPLQMAKLRGKQRIRARNSSQKAA